MAQADADGPGRYIPLAPFNVQLPAGWDGVLARALAPMPQARFEALSEFELALRQPLQLRAEPTRRTRRYRSPWQLVLLGLLLTQLGIGLWLSLNG